MRVRDESKETAIRNGAMEMIVQQGFDGLSMQKLAKAANVSPATIYIYFKDREDLIMQLCKDAGERVIEQTMLNFDPEMAFEEGLRIQWRNRAAYWISNPVESQFLELVKHSHYYDKFGPAVQTAFSSRMGTFLKNAIRNGEMKVMSKEVYWSVCFAPLYQLIKYHIAGKGLGGTDPFVLTDDIREEALRLVLQALKP